MRKILAVVLSVGILLGCSGCLHKKHRIRVVEQICVQWVENDQDVCHFYDRPEKMQLILNKVRTLGQRFSSDTDPETLKTATVTMTLLYSDGSQQQYRFKPDRYVQIGQNPWQQANPKKVTSLGLLLKSLPEDAKT